jgi:membrane-associated phospholipid phosphatase
MALLLLRSGVCLLLLFGTVDAEMLRRDFQNLFTYRNFAGAAVGLGLAGVAHQWDDEVEGELEEAWLMEGPADLTNVYGSTSFNLPVSLGLWGVGKATGRDGLERVGSGLLRTLAFTQLVVAPIKLTVRRERPDGSNRLSFPSGHTANSFAVARFLHRSYGSRVGIPLYAVGVFVAAGRLEEDRHFLSDVVMGAVLGTIIGNSITLERGSSIGAAPRITPDGVLLTAWINF